MDEAGMGTGMEKTANAPGAAPHLHHGHRDRMRERAERTGLDGFADHEVLELLLFQVLPRVNTNPIAHRLLKRFGSLSAVLEADPADLAGIDGMGAKGGAFLALLPHLSRRYLKDRTERDDPLLNHPDTVANYVVPLMAGRKEEAVFLLCLDARCRVRFPALLATGTVAEAHVHPRHAVEAALRHQAASAILVHNHPSGDPTPSTADQHLTEHLFKALDTVEVPLLDHVIVGSDAVFSFQKEGLMPG
ncbi:MAG: DNA repair protein RadC [Leptospirillia bacterium]